MRKIARLCAPLALALALSMLGSAAASPPPEHEQGNNGPRANCQDGRDVALPLTLTLRTGADQEEAATGQYALPQGPPKGLVVFAHGYGHTSDSWVEHMKRTAAKHDVIAVAMDYRGLKITPDSNDDGLREATGWPVMAGAEDSIAAAQHFEASCSTIETIVLLGVSMGGNSSGIAMALASENRRQDGSPLFDYWIDVEGATNLIETYNEARAVAPANGFAKQAQADIEEETGGTFEQQPQAYLDRCVVCRADDIAASGVKGAVVIHGVDDGLVPYNQGREMTEALVAAGVPTDMFTVGRKSPESERETTITGTILGNVDPDYRSPLAGHASEKSTTHIVMVTAFERLAAIFSGESPGPYREFMVDGEAGTFGPP